MRIPTGRVYGPVAHRVLERWYHEHRIDQSCHVRQEGQAWQPAASVFPQLEQLEILGRDGRQVSDKSRAFGGLLGLMFGIFGVHRFYLGYPEIGILMLFTLGGCGVWSTIDAILVLCGTVPDADGRPLS